MLAGRLIFSCFSMCSILFQEMLCSSSLKIEVLRMEVESIGGLQHESPPTVIAGESHPLHRSYQTHCRGYCKLAKMRFQLCKPGGVTDRRKSQQWGNSSLEEILWKWNWACSQMETFLAQEVFGSAIHPRLHGQRTWASMRSSLRVPNHSTVTRFNSIRYNIWW